MITLGESLVEHGSLEKVSQLRMFTKGIVKIKECKLSFSSLSFSFYCSFDLFFIFLFLELRVRVSDNITWSHISHFI